MFKKKKKNLCCSKTLDSFRKGEIDVLISSDAIARGMDVEGVRNVINYDMAPYVKTYIHRAGRTARAGQSGRCFTILRKGEVVLHSWNCMAFCLYSLLSLACGPRSLSWWNPHNDCIFDNLVSTHGHSTDKKAFLYACIFLFLDVMGSDLTVSFLAISYRLLLFSSILWIIRTGPTATI